jgi:class 3 adenylate cyclase/HAMP domain-containing protein
MVHFGSIRTRLMLATTFLVVAVVGAVVWVWTEDVRSHDRKLLEKEARASAMLLAIASMNELDDENWSQIRIAAELLLAGNEDYAYVIVSDARKGDRIIAAVPDDLTEQYVPDIVRLDVTKEALALRSGTRSVETHLLRDIAFGGEVRARRGQRVVEVSAPVRTASGNVIGTFRVGLSLSAMERAVAAAARTALGIGALALFVGLLGAFFVAQRMARPVRDLQASVARIAGGDLEHRVQVARNDEIGSLALSFNEMTVALKESFAALRATLESFERFVPRKFISVIAPDGISNVQVGVGSERRVSVLFSDIRGWTSLAEDMAPAQLFQFLNDYLGRMGTAIDAHGGFIDKFIGDAIMALFDDAHTDGALDAAIAMRRSLGEFNRERGVAGLPPIENGIGVHAGDVVMGTVGYASRIDPTAIGDAVNLASRIEGLTKDYGCPVLVTGAAVAQLAHPERYRLRLVDEAVKVRGKDDAIVLYELELPERAIA